MKRYLLISACTLYLLPAQSQNVAINTTGLAPDASAMLDIVHTSKGLLIPRVALTATNAAAPITAPTTSLLVYNTATAGAAPNNVTPGYYYWNGSAWLRFMNGNGTAWTTTGNAGTAIATNFLGTTDNVPMGFRANNVERMRIMAAGEVVVGSTTVFGGDVFSSYTTNANDAICGYATSTGSAYYGQNTSTGFTAAFLQGSSGGNLFVQNIAAATGRAGEFQTLNTTGTSITLFATNSTTSAATTVSAIWGQSSGTRGVVGLANLANANSIGVNGQYIGGGNIDAIGTLGLANSGAGWGYGVVGQASYRGVHSQGNFSATGTKTFQIDHPADPENKFLLHYCMESPEVLNLYRGTVTLDANGEAYIEMPDYFHLININFSYQLTPVGAAMPGLFVAEEIDNNGKFKVSGGAANKKVSWVVYAERNDRWVQQYPFSKEVEMEKKPHEKGKYLHPELYNQPKEKGIFYFEEKAQKPTQANFDQRMKQP